jgi:hypothetical protein
MKNLNKMVLILVNLLKISQNYKNLVINYVNFVNKLNNFNHQISKCITHLLTNKELRKYRWIKR